MRVKQVWVHTQETWKQKGRKDIVVEGMRKKEEIDWNGFEQRMQLLTAGWRLKEEKNWETVQEYGLPKLTGKFL